MNWFYVQVVILMILIVAVLVGVFIWLIPTPTTVRRVACGKEATHQVIFSSEFRGLRLSQFPCASNTLRPSPSWNRSSP